MDWSLSHADLFAGLRFSAMIFWLQIMLRVAAEPVQVLAAADAGARRLKAWAWFANAAAITVCFSPAQIMALSGWPGIAWLERLLVLFGLIGINVSAQCFLAAQERVEGRGPAQIRLNILLTIAIVGVTAWGFPDGL